MVYPITYTIEIFALTVTSAYFILSQLKRPRWSWGALARFMHREPEWGGEDVISGIF